jgi:hypothetical protein
MRPSTAPISPSVSGLARGVDPRIANNQSSWKMVACHYNSTGGVWARRHKRFVRAAGGGQEL